ncbi:MAG TPA: helix-turn-helix domain-containing protein [Solirubrobacteraceae bacterium]|nr:helix-turn-helix domain-containing protein [Solirubrobacteraceae bacterium]
MASDLALSVRQAADRLGVSPAAVRLRIAGGELPAVKLGRDWRVDEREVLRLARRGDGAGRPLSAAMAWAVLLLASGDQPAADRLAGAPRYRARARQWLREHPLADYADRLRERARREVYDAHPSELRALRERSDVLLTGASAADVVGLLGASAVEFYAPAARRDAVVAEHALMAGPGAVTVRWVPDEVWAELDAAERVAPRAAALVDLLESEDPRARREGARALAP